MDKIIGRISEQKILKDRTESRSPEFIAIYGRRRVGKTFLVRQFYKDKFDFYATGVYGGKLKNQLAEFSRQLEHYSSVHNEIPDNWFDAFAMLREYLSRKPGRRPLIVFLDELPWFDTPRSQFLKAFEYFWNSWGSTNDRLKLIICGSSTTWMRKKVLYSKGGLYNRMTRSIYLQPFTLFETERYLKYRGLSWTRYQIAECYMILGGIPFYLSLLEKGMSVSQNIDNLFFKKKAPLALEYSFLFESLFRESVIPRQIIETLSRKAVGMTRIEILDATNIPDGGNVTEALQNLIDSDFIRKYMPFGKNKKDTIYQLTDLFTLFHLRYVKDFSEPNKHRWQNMLDSPSRRAWSGYAFEQLCLQHVDQIRSKLGIDGVLNDVYSWKGPGGQIDLVIDRRDQVVNLCEIKFSNSKYAITKQYDEHLRERAGSFREATKTKKAIHQTFVTTYGLANNKYSGSIQSQVVLDDLFKE